MLTVAGTRFALKHVGRPVPNVPLLGAFCALGGHVGIDAVRAAIRQRFAGAVAVANVAAADEAYAWVLEGGAPGAGERGARGRAAGHAGGGGGRRVLRQIEGSQAVAQAVALCRPEVVCAYPISPQTHIVEGLGELVKNGALSPCEFVKVESEFAAMSVAIGASAAGARAYTATASQGPAVHGRGRLQRVGPGAAIVMTVANRAIGAPINI